MDRLGTFADARAKVLADTTKLLSTVRRITGNPIRSVEIGISVLKQLRAETYEDLNQIQHEFMVLCAAEWLVTQNRCPPETIWSWNPRQTGLASEPDLRGEHIGGILLSAEITTSSEPKGLIDSRMRRTLQKLSKMPGMLFYFTASPAMCRRALTKTDKSEWQIEAVHLPVVANASNSY